jgi:hypothetical protein
LLETYNGTRLRWALETGVARLLWLRKTVDARRLVLGITVGAVWLRFLVTKVHRSIIVLNTSHVLTHTGVGRQGTNWWKWGTMSALDGIRVSETRGTRGVGRTTVILRVVESVVSQVSGTIDARLLTTLWLEAIETSDLSTKLSVLQTKGVGLTTGSLRLVGNQRNGLASLNKLTLQSLMLRNSYERSACPKVEWCKRILTLSQNLPLASLWAALLRHQITQHLEELLHLCTTLTLSKLVANSKLRGTWVWLSAARWTSATVLKIAQLLVLQRVVMVRLELGWRTWNIISWHAVLQATLASW